MSVPGINNYVSKSYGEIKLIVNDANREISKFNRKTIAKIVTFLAIFILSGVFSVLACIKMGMAVDLASFATLPSFIAGSCFDSNFTSNNLEKKKLFIKNINKNIKEKLKNYTLSIKDAIFFNKKYLDIYYDKDKWFFNQSKNYFERLNRLFKGSGCFTISKLKLDSCDRVNKRYQKDLKRYLPGFLQQTIEKIKKRAAVIADFGLYGFLDGFLDDLFADLAIPTILLTSFILLGVFNVFVCMEMGFAVNLKRIVISSLFVGGSGVLYLNSFDHKKEAKNV